MSNQAQQALVQSGAEKVPGGMADDCNPDGPETALGSAGLKDGIDKGRGENIGVQRAESDNANANKAAAQPVAQSTAEQQPIVVDEEKEESSPM